MGIVTYLRDSKGELIEGLTDPSGGSFDASGDFDRFIDPPDGPSLTGVDPYDDTSFAGADLSRLSSEIEALLALELSGAERRGLLRLRVMAARALNGNGSLTFVGD